MLGRFHKVFGIQDSLETERGRFVERINQTVFPRIENLSYSYESIFKKVCYLLGTNANDRIAQANAANYFNPKVIPHLRSLTQDEFVQTLKVLSLLNDAIESAHEQEALSAWIQAALSHATLDIGVGWKEGTFYRTGARELDESLVEEPLEWLTDFPNEKANYLKALTAYTSKQMDEVVTNCYLTIEGMARSVLKNQRTLDNNREELLKKLGLSQPWKGLLSNFITYANESARHASENRHDLNPIEIEGFLYMTGLLVRMIAHEE
jgi:hypothetical protein